MLLPEGTLLPFSDPIWLLLVFALPLLWRRVRGPRSAWLRARSVALNTLRSLVLFFLIVALAGPLGSRAGGEPELMFVLDMSRSIAADAQRQAIEFVNTAYKNKPDSLRAGLVLFGAEPVVQSPLSVQPLPITTAETDVLSDATDVQRALEMAMSAFSTDTQGQRRVVLLSDARENLGELGDALTIARSMGVRVYSVPLHRGPLGNEVYVHGLSAPRQVNAHEPFELQINVMSTHADPAHLLVTRDGTVIEDKQVSLSAGMNTFSVVQAPEATGLLEYEAVINAPRDAQKENNRARTFVRVEGGPRVLHIASSRDWGQYVSDALRTQGFSVDERSTSELPSRMHELADYQLVILNNVSALEISLGKLVLIEDYVRNTGGGLIVLGGDRSYSAGGYQDTPLERVLPVAMDVRTQVKIPTLAVTIILDRSGSMSSQTRGESKLDIAKRAAFASVALLNPRDRVAVLAFDAEPEWILRPTNADNQIAIARNLSDLGAGGGTDLHGALEEARQVMSLEQAKLKHLILLSDGLTEGVSNFGALLEAIEADGITLSAVALGADANRALLAQLAARGGGRYYYTDDPRNVPRIFTSETIVVSRALVVEESLFPVWRKFGDPLRGFDPASFPPLGGYQLTYAKPGADVLLGTNGEEPLMVSWRYGAGKSLVFTSDLSARWGKDWIGWSQFGRFLAQTARWAMRRQGGERMHPQFRIDSGHAQLLVDVLDGEEQFINELQMQATVVDAMRATQRIALAQTAPGRYEARFATVRAGRYFVSLSGRNTQTQVGPVTYGVAVPHSSEYLYLGADEAVLRQIAQSTGGRLLPLAQTSLQTLFDPGDRSASDRRYTLWWPWLWLALLALLIEVSVRKLVIPQRWSQWLRTWFGSVPREPEADIGHEALLSSIARARQDHLNAINVGEHEMRRIAADQTERARLYVRRLGKR